MPRKKIKNNFFSLYGDAIVKIAGVVVVLTLPILISSAIPTLIWIYLLLFIIYAILAFDFVRHALVRYRDFFTVISIFVAILIFAVNRYEGDARTRRILAAENQFNYDQAIARTTNASVDALFSLLSYRPHFDFILRHYGSQCATLYVKAINLMEQLNATPPPTEGDHTKAAGLTTLITVTTASSIKQMLSTILVSCT